MGMRIYSDSAIDDFSMAPECFGLNMDPAELGDYNYYDPSFEEKTTPHPAFADKPCKLIATGASGGLGSAWAGVSHAAAVRALVELHKSERVYILVGQQGINACKKTLSAQEGHHECSRRTSNETSQVFTSKTHEVRNTHVSDGGGGGGGATYVFLLDKDGQAFPLLVAGGGGGISVGSFRDDGSQHARPLTNATPESGYMYGQPGKTSGAGGGWLARSGPTTPGFELVRGAALHEGGGGGAACAGQADGGFGGGGGGCLRGGGGGGWLDNTYQRKKEAEQQQKRLLEQDVQLQRLRSAPGGNDNLTMAFNPHYGSESILPQGIDVRGLPQVSRESLKLVKALGQGAFGEVYQGLYRHRTGDTVEMPVAVKTLPELSTGQAESDFLMEAAIMAKFSHPNIVHLIGVCFDRHPRFIVLELLAGGDLKNFLRESRPKPERASALTMKDLLLCSIDVCKGCRYLESKRFIHRDIAARNCLLTSRGPGRVVKIADFGMARDIYRSDYYKKGGKAMLPIKSFGVLLWEVFSLGVMPYTGCANREVMEMVSGGGRLEKPYGCPQEIYRLMCECWNPTPGERPSFAHMYERMQRFVQ
ncbi:hypothetical protein HF086_012490, partial [Spodoptera exigua]